MRIGAEEYPRFSGDDTEGHACMSILFFFFPPSRPGDVENDRVKGGAEEARAGEVEEVDGKEGEEGVGVGGLREVLGEGAGEGPVVYCT